jgi:DNA-binding LytR/AlgR family response regulator
MNRPTALIADDEPLLRDGLATGLRAAWPGLQVVASVGDGHSALSSALALAPQVCFLDIRMPGLDGLAAAQALAEDWPGGATAPPFPLIVFVTAYDAYALQAFDHAAVDYLLKPVEPARLARCVRRLQGLLAQREAAPARLEQAVGQLQALLAATPGADPAAAPPLLDVITASAGARTFLVPVDDVVYFEAADKYVRVVTAEREHLIRTSLRDLLPQLDARRFWQVHRSVVVQARCIDSAWREESGKVTLTLRGRPEKLTASRLYAHRFRGL